MYHVDGRGSYYVLAFLVMHFDLYPSGKNARCSVAEKKKLERLPNEMMVESLGYMICVFIINSETHYFVLFLLHQSLEKRKYLVWGTTGGHIPFCL